MLAVTAIARGARLFIACNWLPARQAPHKRRSAAAAGVLAVHGLRSRWRRFASVRFSRRDHQRVLGAQRYRIDFLGAAASHLYARLTRHSVKMTNFTDGRGAVKAFDVTMSPICFAAADVIFYFHAR